MQQRKSVLDSQKCFVFVSDPKLLDAQNNPDAEDEIEKRWVQLNGIGSPEMGRPPGEHL